MGSQDHAAAVVSPAAESHSRPAARSSPEALAGFFDLLAVSSGDVIFRYRIEAPRGFEYLSPSVEGATGFTAEEFFEDPDLYRRLLMPEDVDRYRDALSQFQESKPLEIRWRRKDGTLYWADIRAVPVWDARGQIVAMQGISRDISDRVGLEEELRLKSAALEAAANAIVMTDAEGRIIWVNRAFTQLTGYEAAEVLGRNPRVLKSGVQDDAVYEQLWKTIGAGNVWQGEIVNRHKDGHLYTEEMTITPVASRLGEITHYIAIKQDVTVRRQAEEELRQSELCFRALAENMLDLVAILDRDGVIRYASPSHFSCNGFHPEDLVGRSAFDFVHPDDVASLRATFVARVESEGYSARTQYRFRHRDGSWRVVEGVARNLYGDPSVQGVLVNSRDITERVQAEEEILSLNRQLEQRVRERTAALEAANHELESFSYSVSHDLRAPLRSIDGFSEALLEDHAAQLDERGKYYLSRLRAASRHLLDLIGDLLQLSRVGRYELERRRVDLSALAAEVVAELREREPDRRVEVSLGAGLEVSADPTLLRQMLGNLLGNAWKYTGKKEGAHIELGSVDRDGERVYFVRDDGVGFDMTYAERIFESFQRLHSSNEFEGTGVGLATVRRILSRHGGRAWAEGAVGTGATFFFTLPDA
jgi:PAS domain S-box-containing protein